MPIPTECKCVRTPVASRSGRLGSGNHRRHIYKGPTVYILTMTAALRLSVEPTPARSRRASLANLMPRVQWDCLRRSVYRKAHYRCQICGSEGKLYCHEIWQYNEETGYQFLRGFSCLCKACHDVKHIFFVRDSWCRASLFRHFLTVNRVTREQGIKHLVDAYRQQQGLNQRDWIVNYGEYNWQIPATKSVRQRRDYARLNRPSYC